MAYQKLPVVYLNLDLVIQKANQAFADLVSFLGDIRGKHLGDLLEAQQNESMQRLRNELRDERDEREPTYSNRKAYSTDDVCAVNGSRHAVHATSRSTNIDEQFCTELPLFQLLVNPNISSYV
ncbi:unnamed protein product [Alternaria sp. RS040]